MDWKGFWDQPNAIYVNERHRIVHYRLIAQELLALAGTQKPILLDHGCGEALQALDVAKACQKLYLLDAAPSVRAKLSARCATTPNIAILAPDDIASLDNASLDLIVANSLLQYLSESELIAALQHWRDKLKPDGRLILADVVRPDVSALPDVLALLSLAWREGFFLAALAGLLRTALSPYARLRKTLGLSKYSEKALIDLVMQAGFSAEHLARNLGHNQARMTVMARPR